MRQDNLSQTSLSQDSLSGMILIDKPAKITSFIAVHKVRKTLGVKKCGHCGTLDPFATGLLIIMTGKATKFQEKFMKQDKVYVADFLLGITTDTCDITGTTISEQDASHITKLQVLKALRSFEGEIEQVPPMYSAIQHKGVRLYALARKGIEIERKARKVNIKKIELLSFKDSIARVYIECSSGTYIRSIAGDLGKILGVGAVVSELRREKIGEFDVKDAVAPKDLDNADLLKEKLILLMRLVF